MSDAIRRIAQTLDQHDMLAGVASQFYKQPGDIYLDGNSLGLLSSLSLCVRKALFLIIVPQISCD